MPKLHIIFLDFEKIASIVERLSKDQFRPDKTLGINRDSCFTEMLRTVSIRKDGRCHLYFEEITGTVRALIYNNSEGLNHQQISL